MSKAKQLRIFLTSSQLSTAFYSIYASKSANKELYFDVLLIDCAPKKKALVKNILERAAIFHSWDFVLDMSSPINDETSTRPSIKKRFIRKVKTFPIVENIYAYLLSFYNKKINAVNEAAFCSRFPQFNQFSTVSLHLLTQTLVNPVLFQLYPNAEIHFFEHGTGDYFYALEKNRKLDCFHCFFAQSFQQYLKNQKLEIKTHEYLSKADFEQAFSLPENDLLYSELVNILESDSNEIQLILLDAFEIYHPPIHFWTDFLERILREITQPDKMFFVLKPHPNQSAETIALSVQYFKDRNLLFVLLNRPELSQLSVETFFVMNQHRIKAVYSTFSSALFYLSHYYIDRTEFYMLYDFASGYISSAPNQYKEVFKGLKPLIDQVFDADKKIKRL